MLPGNESDAAPARSIIQERHVQHQGKVQHPAIKPFSHNWQAPVEVGIAELLTWLDPPIGPRTWYAAQAPSKLSVAQSSTFSSIALSRFTTVSSSPKSTTQAASLL